MKEEEKKKKISLFIDTWKCVQYAIFFLHVFNHILKITENKLVSIR